MPLGRSEDTYRERELYPINLVSLSCLPFPAALPAKAIANTLHAVLYVLKYNLILEFLLLLLYYISEANIVLLLHYTYLLL